MDWALNEHLKSKDDSLMTRENETIRPPEMSNREEPPDPRRRRRAPTPDSKAHIVVIIATATLLAVAVSQTSDYMKSAFMEKFQVDEKMASVPNTVLSVLPDTVGILVGPLQHTFSIRSVMIVGSVLAWIGIMVSGFASNIPIMSVTLGVVHGIGSGTILVSLYLLTMMHFSKFRGVAHGAASLGKPLSGLVFTELLNFFKESYGIQGSLFVLGALSMHLTPLAYVLRAPFSSRAPSMSKRPTTVGADISNESGKYIEMQEFGKPKEELPQSCGCYTEFRTLFASPAFYIVIISSAVTAVIDTIFLTTVIDFAVDQGSVKSDAAWLKPCYVAASAFGRIFLPLIADTKCLRRSTFVMLSFVLVGVTLLVVPFATTYWIIAVLCALTAAFLGGGSVLHDVLVVDYLSMERLSIIHGAIGVVKAPLIISSPLLVDALYSMSGSHNNLYRLKGGLLIFFSLIWLSVVCGERNNRLKVPAAKSE
ncbi:uncharacterized protein LOC8025047 [Ixodes scapularis]|uniref:uncharacterized protein LOC8025047 n=1 Tax=Ixodes scapularis TaxID=6945 RepID=UPI001A9E3553|nr:uncharacterized protein LOC8025047 [Ixodes scapularis]